MEGEGGSGLTDWLTGLGQFPGLITSNTVIEDQCRRKQKKVLKVFKCFWMFLSRKSKRQSIQEIQEICSEMIQSSTILKSIPPISIGCSLLMVHKIIAEN